MSEIKREDALAHFGVKGMRWGQTRRSSSAPVKTYATKKAAGTATKRESKTELKKFRAQDRANMRDAKKDPTFKREVKAAKKGEGVVKALEGNSDVRFLKGGYLTSTVVANFKNTKQEKVSVEFANAVMNKAVSDKHRKDAIKIGALYLAAGLAPLAAKKLSS